MDTSNLRTVFFAPAVSANWSEYCRCTGTIAMINPVHWKIFSGRINGLIITATTLQYFYEQHVHIFDYVWSVSQEGWRHSIHLQRDFHDVRVYLKKGLQILEIGCLVTIWHSILVNANSWDLEKLTKVRFKSDWKSPTLRNLLDISKWLQLWS